MITQGPLDLKASDVDAPKPEADQYTIRIHAAGTNFFDLLQIRGKYQHQPPFPWIAGAEFAGVVTATPSKPKNGKAKYNPGDRVFGSTGGSYAEQICVREESLRPIPKDFSFEEGAGLFSTMSTSYGGLVTRANIKAGEWVLVHAAAGGVGLAAVQIAKAFGAKVIATAGTDHKLEVAKRFGADYGVNYRDDKWWEKVQALTPNKRGVDIVYDPVGLIDKSMKCIAWGGRLIVIGFVGGTWEQIATNRILLKNISVVGMHLGSYQRYDPAELANIWDKLFELFEAGKVRGTVYDEKEYVGLESVPEALEALGKRQTWGKVVVKIPQRDEGQSKL